MCNLYSITKGPQAIRDFARVMHDTTGNLPPIPGVFPDYSAPIVRNLEEGARELNDGSMGHAVARLRLEGPQLRSWRHQCPQRLFAALAPMAGRREPMRRAVHELRRERTPARRLPAAGLVCSRG